MAEISRNGRKDTEVHGTIEGSAAYPTKCLPKNKVTKLFGNHPHLWHSCDSFIRDLLMLFLSRFYHECHECANATILIGYFSVAPYSTTVCAHKRFVHLHNLAFLVN
ncbi:MAG: hypothetical protein C5S48_03635 [Candidatus Methanogaster sp.]|nr:MAG: hypothetical protein C5S48_03635 [ANME-2 cluster archaeon]